MNLDTPPFGRGEVGTGYSDPATLDTTANVQYEGMEYPWPDLDYTNTGNPAMRSNRQVRCRIVRNKSGAAILPKKVLKNAATAQTTTLNGAINSSVTSVVVTSGAAFTATVPFLVMVDNEIMNVTLVSTNTLTVQRGQNGTTAASHLTAAVISLVTLGLWEWGNWAGGYAALGDPILGVADEFLPAAGCPDGGLFWAVIRGPSMCLTDSAGDTTIPIGKVVVPGGGTAGNVVEQDVSVVTATNIYNQLQSAVGRVMHSTIALSSNVLVDVGAIAGPW